MLTRRTLDQDRSAPLEVQSSGPVLKATRVVLCGWSTDQRACWEWSPLALYRLPGWGSIHVCVLSTLPSNISLLVVCGKLEAMLGAESTSPSS